MVMYLLVSPAQARGEAAIKAGTPLHAPPVSSKCLLEMVDIVVMFKICFLWPYIYIYLKIRNTQTLYSSTCAEDRGPAGAGAGQASHQGRQA